MRNNEPGIDTLGSKAKYLRIITGDGHMFVMNRKKVFKWSTTIRNMCNGPCKLDDDDPCEIILKEVSSEQMNIVCHYIKYKDRYSNAEEPIPLFQISREKAESVLLAAHFLLVPSKDDSYDTSEDELA